MGRTMTLPTSALQVKDDDSTHISICRSKTMTLPTSALAFLFFYCSVVPAASLCNSGDRDALLRIKSSLGNPPSLWTWGSDIECCAWDHVQCTSDGRVVNLVFLNFNMSFIPPQVVGLTALKSLTIASAPSLIDPIPLFLIQISSLESLIIKITSVSGEVPAFLARMTRLTFIDLSENKLSGSIPPALATIPGLRGLDLRGNRLSGVVPPLLVHGDGSILWLSRNQLTGEIPRAYGTQRDISSIDLSHNRLTGDPSFLFGADKRALTNVDLSWNELEFDLGAVEFPRQLMFLDLSHNRIRGQIPKSLAKVKDLKSLNVSFNQLCGEIPKSKALQQMDASAFANNKCLCGPPLAACSKIATTQVSELG